MPIAVPTLTVEDNGDGTGAVATIADSTGGSTNTVSVVKWTGTAQSTAWESEGSRSGDGTVSLSLTKGYYWAKCESVSGGESVTSNLVYFAVTDGDDAVHQRCFDAAVARLEGMTFEDPDATAQGGVMPRVYAQQSLDTVDVEMPCIIVVYPRDGTREEGGTNERDDISYPVYVFVVDRDARQNDKPKYRRWKEQIMRAFRHGRVDTVEEVMTCIVQDQHVIDPAQWTTQAYQHVSTALLLWFRAREVRGVE